MAGKKELPKVDGRTLEAFKKKAKSKGGSVIDQLPIQSWKDQEPGFILAGDFIGIRQGKKKRGSDMEPGFLLDIFNTDKGEPECWGCPAALKQRLEQHMVTAGDSLEIMLTGQYLSQYNTPGWEFAVAHYPKAATS